MAIKVKHSGNAAPMAAASFVGGKGKRQQQDSEWLTKLRAQRDMQSEQLMQQRNMEALRIANSNGGRAAIVNAPTGAGSGGNAPLISAPSGASMSAPSGAPLGGGRGGNAASDYKVTGTSVFDRPDNESVWDNSRRQWIRKWLPGEKEAEARGRVGAVDDQLAAAREQRAQDAARLAIRRKAGIDDTDTTDYSQADLNALISGQKILDYPQDVKARFNDLDSRLNEEVMSGRLVSGSPDYNSFVQQIDAAKRGVRKTLVDNPEYFGRAAQMQREDARRLQQRQWDLEDKQAEREWRDRQQKEERDYKNNGENSKLKADQFFKFMQDAQSNLPEGAVWDFAAMRSATERFNRMWEMMNGGGTTDAPDNPAPLFPFSDMLKSVDLSSFLKKPPETAPAAQQPSPSQTDVSEEKKKIKTKIPAFDEYID